MVEMSATITGTSTMHEWTSKVNEIVFDGQVSMDSGKITSINNVTVKVPVSSIKSERGNLMDRNTWNSLRKDEYPNIDFNLSEASIINKQNGDIAIHAVGELTLIGNTRTTDIDMSATLTDAKTLFISGSKDLLMSDFDMEAPSFLFGAYTTGDLVTFDFELTMMILEDQQISSKME
jgi:hypothetical protein